jgi:hypothetical protein
MATALFVCLHDAGELAEDTDVVVTMGCRDPCPEITGKRYIDWDLPDPKGRARGRSQYT